MPHPVFIVRWKPKILVENPEAAFYDPTERRNPPYGAAINFYLKSKLEEKDRLRLTITDAQWENCTKNRMQRAERGRHGSR